MLVEPFHILKTNEYCTPFPATLENAFFKNLHNQPAAEELHLIHHKSGPPSPDGARSKAFFPAGAGQNLPLRHVPLLSLSKVNAQE